MLCKVAFWKFLLMLQIIILQFVVAVALERKRQSYTQKIKKSIFAGLEEGEKGSGLSTRKILNLTFAEMRFDAFLDLELSSFDQMLQSLT